MSKREVRTFTGGVEARAAKDSPDGMRHIVGTGAVMGEWSPTYWDHFKEMIEPGAFDGALESSDVRGLFNHDSNHILGRVAAGTMLLSVDEKALRYDIVLGPPGDSSIADHVYSAILRGDITGSSFAFTVEEDEEKKVDGIYERRIKKFKELFDTGPVTFPFYPQTEAQVRSLIEEFEQRHQSGATVGEEAVVGAGATTGSEALALRRRQLETRERFCRVHSGGK